MNSALRLPVINSRFRPLGFRVGTGVRDVSRARTRNFLEPRPAGGSSSPLLLAGEFFIGRKRLRGSASFAPLEDAFFAMVDVYGVLAARET